MSWYGWWNELLRPLQREADETPDPAPEASPNRRFGRLRQLQRAYGNQYFQRLLSKAPSAGRPLNDATRTRMESAFGENLGAVRVHADAEAQAVTSSSSARAVTIGQDIYLAPNRSHPNSLTDDHLLAHEIAHVVQQRRGGSGPSDAAQEADAERAARAVQSGSPATVTKASASGVPQFAPPTSSGSVPPHRVILIDADVIDQLNRGNANAAKTLRELLSSADVYISQQAFNELTAQPGTMIAGVGPDIPRTATANRILLRDLGIQVGPPGALAQRVDVLEKNVTEIHKGGTVLSERDVRTAAEARATNAEVWSFDDAYVKNRIAIETKLGVRVAPETGSIERWVANGDYRVARSLMNLDPVEISLSGEIKVRGGAPPSEGGEPGEGRSVRGAPGTERGAPEGAIEAKGGSGLLGKLLTTVGVIFTAKDLYRAAREGPEEFGLEVGKQAMIWGSAATLLGPLGPPLMAFEFWFGERFGQAMAAIPLMFKMLADAFQEIGRVTSSFGRMAPANLLKQYYSLNPENWDEGAMTKELMLPTHDLGVALWSKIVNMDGNQFLAALHQPLSALDVSRTAAFNFTSQWEALQTKKTGTPIPFTPDQLLAMTPLQLLNFLKADQLRFIQDPEVLVMSMLEDPSTLVLDQPHTFGKKERDELSAVVETRTRVNAYKWDLSGFPKLLPREDAESIRELGLTIWSRLEPLDKQEFQQMSLKTLDNFNLAPEQLNKVATTLARIPFFGAEVATEMTKSIKEHLLRMTPDELAKYLVQAVKLRFKKDPEAAARDAIEAVQQGYRPW